MENKITAVEWLVEQIRKDQNQKALSASEWMQVIEEAKAMEKEQIMKAVDRGYDEGCKFPEDMTLRNSEQYYNETYGS